MIARMYPGMLEAMATGAFDWTTAHAVLVGEGYTFDAAHTSGSQLSDVLTMAAVGDPAVVVDGTKASLRGSIVFPGVSGTYRHIVVVSGATLSSAVLAVDLDTETPVTATSSAVIVDVDPVVGLLRIGI